MAPGIEDALAHAMAAAAAPNPLTAVAAAVPASPEAVAAATPSPPSFDADIGSPLAETARDAVSPPMDKASVTAISTAVCQSVVQKEMEAFSANLSGNQLNPLGSLVSSIIERVIVTEKSLAPALVELQSLHSENKDLRARVSALDHKLNTFSDALRYLASVHNGMKQQYDGLDQITSLFPSSAHPAPAAKAAPPGSKRLRDDDFLHSPLPKTPRGTVAENESDATQAVADDKTLKVKDWPDHNEINGKTFTNDRLGLAKELLERKKFIVSGSTIKAHVLPKTFSYLFKTDLMNDVISSLDDDTSYTILIDSVNQARRSRPFPILVTISNDDSFSINGHFSFLNLQKLNAFPDIFSNQLSN